MVAKALENGKDLPEEVSTVARSDMAGARFTHQSDARVLQEYREPLEFDLWRKPLSLEGGVGQLRLSFVSSATDLAEGEGTPGESVLGKAALALR